MLAADCSAACRSPYSVNRIVDIAALVVQPTLPDPGPHAGIADLAGFTPQECP
jgi:hypothetical protein